jgi:hypothetical protein
MRNTKKLRYGALIRGIIKRKKLTITEMVELMNDRLMVYARFWKVKPQSVIVNRDILLDEAKKLSSLIDMDCREVSKEEVLPILSNNNTYSDELAETAALSEEHTTLSDEGSIKEVKTC